MLRTPNAMRWNRRPGHYEVYYLTLTDPRTGVGLWIRYAVLAPRAETREPASCALWFAAMDPRNRRVSAHMRALATDHLRATNDPFELRIADAVLTDRAAAGALGSVSWDLHWAPSPRAYAHVHPVMDRLELAQTKLVLPHADLSIDGTVEIGGERLVLSGARGAQAHLWGSKHASSWAWAHCSDFETLSGEPCADSFVDGVSVRLARRGRELPPFTPVVARIRGRDFESTSPPRTVLNPSVFTLTGWRFEAVDGRVKLIGEVDADRDQLAGVTYHDPDGELAYCYNGETASMRLNVYERSPRGLAWTHRETLVARGRAHFEYGQRTPVPGLELHIS